MKGSLIDSQNDKLGQETQLVLAAVLVGVCVFKLARRLRGRSGGIDAA